MAESLAEVNEKNDNIEEINIDKSNSRKASQMPKPKGYKILIALPEPDEKTDGGIIKSSQTIHTEEVGSIVGFVLDMGPDVYSDSARFPTGAFCKKRGLDYNAFLYRHSVFSSWKRVPLD